MDRFENFPKRLCLETILPGEFAFTEVSERCCTLSTAAGFEAPSQEVRFEPVQISDEKAPVLKGVLSGNSHQSGELRLGTGVRVNIFRDEDRWIWKPYINVEAVSPEGISRYLRLATDFCRLLLDEGLLIGASLTRHTKYCGGIPEVPLVENNCHLILVNQAEVSQYYEHEDSFWNGWEKIAHDENMYLLARALDAAGDLEFLKAVQGHQWAMARAAKPGKTIYEYFEIVKETAHVFSGGPEYLKAVAYLPDKKTMEMSCYVEEPGHISPLQIYQVFQLLEEGALPDGRPLQTIRIVFPEKAMADREKRPLLDIGARVFFENSEGDLVEITE